jgi:hypothetical protein
VLTEFESLYIAYLKPFNSMAVQDDAANRAKFYVDDNLSNTLKSL